MNSVHVGNRDFWVESIVDETCLVTGVLPVRDLRDVRVVTKSGGTGECGDTRGPCLEVGVTGGNQELVGFG